MHCQVKAYLQNTGTFEILMKRPLKMKKEEKMEQKIAKPRRKFLTAAPITMANDSTAGARAGETDDGRISQLSTYQHREMTGRYTGTFQKHSGLSLQSSSWVAIRRDPAKSRMVFAQLRLRDNTGAQDIALTKAHVTLCSWRGRADTVGYFFLDCSDFERESR
jgi:hypothetical protein